MKLTEMLQTVATLDEQALEIPEELALDLKDKVDSYVSVMDRLELDAEHYRKLSAYFREKAKARENELERFKDYTKRSMEAFSWDELKGNLRKLKLVNQKRFSILRDANATDYENNPFLVKQIVTVEYEWNKDELKHAHETGKFNDETVCAEKEIRYVRKT